MRDRLIAWAGYDPDITARLPGSAPKMFIWASALALVIAALAAAGVFYGGWLAVGSLWPAAIAGAVAGPVVLNLFRMQHAGTGYPVFMPIERLPWWRPSLAGAVVFFFLGAMLLQPLVLLVLRPVVGPGVSFGLIAQTHATWELPLAATLCTAVFGALMATPSTLRYVFVESVRAYERERWIDDRMLVDDAFADAQDLIHRALALEPRYAGRLAVHFVDPPYNTRPLWFGVDPRAVERGQVEYTKPLDEEQLPEPAPPPPEPPQSAPPPRPAPVVHDEPPPPPEPAEEVTPADEPLFAWDDALDTGEPPELRFVDVGRLPGRVARQHADDITPFIVAYTGRDLDEVRGLLRAAPDDMPMHKLFSEWAKLQTILTKDAGFALDHGLSRIVAIVVGKPVDEVERRLRAAPRDRRLTGVFTSELARRILGKKV